MKIDVSEETFQQEVVDRSFDVPVVLDFWAEWCPPCRVLGPVLEKLADEAGGEWVLAKIDVDHNPRLAQSFGVQGIPAVRAVREGRQVAEFTGAIPEPQVRNWLAQLGPSEADELVAAGRDAAANGDFAGAAQSFRDALALEPAHREARGELALAELKLRSLNHDAAALLRRAESDPDDVEAVAGLADLHIGRGDVQSAFDGLLRIIQTSNGEAREQARLRLLSLFDIFPPDHPDVAAARRSLSLALF